MASINPPVCEFGTKATNFNLPCVDGKNYSYADIKGEKATVVMFICNHCPYVQSIIHRLLTTIKDLKEYGVNFVAISSNDASDYPEDSFENMKVLSDQLGFNFPYLYDADQSIAKKFGAVCTPDFFGYNKRNELQYRGRFDASKKVLAQEGVKRDLYDALKLIAHSGHGPKEQLSSIGCSIKWKNR